MLRWCLRLAKCRYITKFRSILVLIVLLLCMIAFLGNTINNKEEQQNRLLGEGNKKTSQNYDFNKFDDQDWIEVVGSKRKLFVYSAYEDTRVVPPVVRIIAIGNIRYKAKRCTLIYEDSPSIEVEMSTSIMKDHWSLPYTATFLVCKLPSDRSPTSVLISPKKGFSETKLSVQKFPALGNYEKFMTICVKPFHYNYHRALWLVEFVEFHRLLGVTHFYFYNHTVGEDLEKVLKSYIKDGIATVLQWTLPVKSKKDIRTEGIFAALNDCNLRSVGNFRYAMIIDVDEFIVPRMHSNYADLLKFLGHQYSAYIFQNDFFYLYWDNDTTVHDMLYGNSSSLGSKLFGSEEKGPYLLTAYKTNRLTTPHQHSVRSKYITEPRKTLECGNHFVWSFVNNEANRYLEVDGQYGFLQHYRICEFGGFDCITKPHLVDRRAHFWLLPLFERVALECKRMFSLEGTCPKAPPLGSPW